MHRLLASLTLILAFSANSGIVGYNCFRTVPETLASMTNLVNAYPDLARFTNVGYTIEGREILGLVISKQQSHGPKYPVLLTGAIHANEMGPSELLMQFAEQACASYATNGNYRYSLDYSELHIIPIVSVDSRLHVDAEGPQRPYRNNMRELGCITNGININRNFPYDWNWGVDGVQYSTEICNDLYSGEYPSSEPETQAITNYVNNLFPDVRGPLQTDSVSNSITGLILDVHTEAAAVLFYLAWSNAPNPNYNQFLSLARKGRHYTGYGINTLAQSAGTFKRTGFGIWGVPTFTWELGLLGKKDCANFTSHVIPANIPAWEYMIRAGRRPFMEAAAPEIYNLAVSVSTNKVLTITGNATDTRNAEDPSQNITGVRYSISLPPWHSNAFTNAATFTVTGTGTATFTATYDASSLPGGEYVVYADAADGTHGWGVTSGSIFTITDDGSEPTPPTSYASGTIRGAASAIRGKPSSWRMQ